MLNEEQMKDVQSRIDEAATKVLDILKEYELAISGKVIKVEIATGVFGDTFQVGYIDTKFAKKLENKKEAKLAE